MASAPRKVQEPFDLTVLVAVHVGKALRSPRPDGREPRRRGRGRGTPQIGNHRLPGLVPRKAAVRDVGSGRPDVGPEREQMIESAKEIHIPRFAFGNRELREYRIGVDEHTTWNPYVL